MQLGDFLSSAEVRPVMLRPVTVQVCGPDPRSGETVRGDMPALLAFVSDKDRADCIKRADEELAKAFPNGTPVDEDTRYTVRAAHILQRALRDADAPSKPACDTVLRLQNSVVTQALMRLWTAYIEFVEEEFPEEVDPEDFKRLVEAAKKKSVVDLFSDFDSDMIRKAWPSLRAALAPVG